MGEDAWDRAERMGGIGWSGWVGSAGEVGVGRDRMERLGGIGRRGWGGARSDGGEPDGALHLGVVFRLVVTAQFEEARCSVGVEGVLTVIQRESLRVEDSCLLVLS